MAEDIVTLDLAGKTAIADFMVIASGRSARQVLALTERLEAALRRRVRFSIEGKAQADWVLIDAGDVIVHLFRPEIRAYYNLEKMWAEALPDAPTLPSPASGEGSGVIRRHGKLVHDPLSPSRHRQAPPGTVRGAGRTLCRPARAAGRDRRARGAAARCGPRR